MWVAKPWKFEAIVRLVLGVVLCLFAGSLVISALHYAGAGKRSPWFFLVTAAAMSFLGATLHLIRRPLSPEKGPPRFLLLAVTFYGGFLLGFWAEKMAGPLPEGLTAWQVIIAGLSFQGAALLLIARFVREHQASWTEAFGFGNHLGRAVVIGAVAACLFLRVSFELQRASGNVMMHYHIEPKEQEAVEALRATTDWTYRISLGIVAIVLAPAAEEMLFRGIFYPALKQAGFPRLAWFGTALLFALVHVSLVNFAPLFVLALVLTLVYEKTNNLAASITTHALFNAMNFAWLFLHEGTRG